MGFLSVLGGIAGSFLPIPGGSAVGAAIGGALDGKKAANKAANAQVDAGNQANAVQLQMFDKQNELNEPFRQSGIAAQNRLLDYLGLSDRRNSEYFGKYLGDFGTKEFQADPGYQFRLSEGMKALDRSAAARGGLISGAAMKAAQNYGQQAASQEYQNAFNRYQVNRTNQLAPLQSLAGQGQTAAQIIGNAAQSYGNNASDIIQGVGNARASGYVGSQNALNSGIGNALNYLNQSNTINSMIKGFGNPYNNGGIAGYGYRGGYDVD